MPGCRTSRFPPNKKARSESALFLQWEKSLALSAARKLQDTRLSIVADELGVSERHLRRVFLETVGLGPKAFARLARFRRAVRIARAAKGEQAWAEIASATGYYDQAHLIAEFRDIAGTTPRALLRELETVRSIA